MMPSFRKAGTRLRASALSAFRGIAASAGASALAGCATTHKPPEITYDDRRAGRADAPIRPRPSQVVELPKPLPLPGQLKPSPNAHGARRSRPIRPRASTRPMPPRACSRCATASSTPIQVYPFTRRRALSGLCRARPDHRHRACSRASSSSAPARSPPATPCAGSSATPRAARARPSGSISWSSRRGRTSSPTSSSTPTGAPIISSCARPRRPTWRRSPGTIRRTSSSRCAARTRRPRRRAPIATGVDLASAQLPLRDRGRHARLAAAARLRRRPAGLHRVPARHRPGRDAAALRHRPRGRRLRARQLPRPRQLL